MEFDKCWWLIPREDNVLEFSVRQGIYSLLVSSIVAQSDTMLTVTGSEMVSYILVIDVA